MPGPTGPDRCDDLSVLDAEWEQRLRAVWLSADRLSDSELVALIDTLAAELPDGSAVGLFERASALDATAREDLAVPLYREALAAGLTGQRRRRAVIQLASSLRNIGQPHESVELLTGELVSGPGEEEDAVRAFLALALVDVGRQRDAVRVAVEGLVGHSTHYGRALGEYARQLAGPAVQPPAGGGRTDGGEA
jgi:Tetratrico peptide repeat